MAIPHGEVICELKLRLPDHLQSGLRKFLRKMMACSGPSKVSKIQEVDCIIPGIPRVLQGTHSVITASQGWIDSFLVQTR